MRQKNGTSENPSLTVVDNTPETTNEPSQELSATVVDDSTNSVDKLTGELTESQEQTTGKVLPPIELRLKKLAELQEMQEKREVIVQHLENLNRFYVSPSGAGCNLKLTDSKGNTFGISHPAIIVEMVHMAKAKLQDELTKLESAFIFEI